MSDGGFHGGGTAGGKWGCAIAALVGLPVLGVLMLVAALGDCAPGAACRNGFWTMVVLPTLLVVVPVGFGVRWLVNRLRRDAH